MLIDLVRMTSPTTGANNLIALGVAVPGFLSFSQAEVPDGATVSVAVVDNGGAPAQGLTGLGVYSSAAQTVEIKTIFRSTNANVMIPLSGSAQIAISALAEDITPQSVFATRTAAANALIDASINFLQTGGYATAGDGGGARYYRFTGTSPGGFQSLDGAWWAINEVEPNALQFGADNTNNPAVDSGPAIQALFTYASFRPPGGAIDRGGVAVVPDGVYYTGEPLTLPNVEREVHLRGGGKAASYIIATGNFNLLTISGPAKISDLFFQGWNNVANTSQTLTINAGNVTLQDVWVYYGNEGIHVSPTAGNCKLHRVLIAYCLLYSAHFFSTVNCIDCDFDTPWPTGSAPAYGSTIGAWSVLASVSPGTVKTLVQNGVTYYLQCVTGGTTGALQPTVVGYPAFSINDGTAVWQLAMTANTIGVLLDGSNGFAAFQCEFTSCDFSIAALVALQMQNVSGSFVPQILNIDEGSFGGTLGPAMIFAAGGFVMISNCQITGTALSGTASISFPASWSGPAIISGCTFFGQSGVSGGADNAIDLTGGGNTIISNNYFGQQAGPAILVGAGVSSFNINGNIFSTSNGAVTVTAGNSDYYNIVNNILNGAAIADHGTGVNKTISGNH